MMQLYPVLDRSTEKAFIAFPRMLYRDDPNFVMSFDKDIKAAFDPRHNVHFKQGDAMRWILKNSQGKIIGRIAAFYDSKKAEADYVKSGGCGFFECINSQEAANMLFDAAKEWLTRHGFEAMTGPINFGENDNNWGCLVEGFTHPGYGMAYNKPYYQTLFENYGFQLFYRQYSFHLDIEKPFPERFWKIAEWVNNRPNYSFRHFDYKHTEKFVDDLVTIYNKTWSKFKDDFTPLDKAAVYEEMNKAKPIIIPELVWFAYRNEEPIAFFLIFPDANQIIKHLNGKLHLLNKIRFLWLKKRKVMTRMRATAAGVVPAYQNSGIESGIFWQLNQVVPKLPQFKQIELSWVGDFNPKMISLYQATGAIHAKTHITYRYMINQDIPFQRFMEDQVDESKLPGALSPDA